MQIRIRFFSSHSPKDDSADLQFPAREGTSAPRKPAESYDLLKWNNNLAFLVAKEDPDEDYKAPVVRYSLLIGIVRSLPCGSGISLLARLAEVSRAIRGFKA